MRLQDAIDIAGTNAFELLPYDERHRVREMVAHEREREREAGIATNNCGQWSCLKCRAVVQDTWTCVACNPIPEWTREQHEQRCEEVQREWERFQDDPVRFSGSRWI